VSHFLRAATALLFVFSVGLASAQETSTTRRVTFRDGRATLRGVVRGYAFTDYVFPAGAGESMQLSLASGKAFFNVMTPGAGETAMFVGSTSGATFEGAAPSSGDYTARVYLMRNEARRGTRAPYALTIRLGRQSPAQEGGPDFADGLAGGPDNWVVTGVPAGDTLAVRAAPSPRGKRVGQFANGTHLQNLGCRNTGGQRWCRVAGEGRRGWVNGRYLRE
jgi:hypothetical protein